MRHRHHTRRIKCNLVGVARSRLLYIGTVLFILLHSLLLPASHQDLLPQCNKLPAPKNSENSPALPMVVRPMCRTFNIPGICAKNKERRNKERQSIVSSERRKRGRKRIETNRELCVLSNRVRTYFIRERLVRPVARAHGAAYRAAQCGAGEDALHAPALGHSFDHRWGCSCVGAFCVSI